MQILRLRLAVFCLALILAALAGTPSSVAQDFSITATDLLPSPVDQGAAAAATLTLKPLGGFNGQVNLQCSISPALTNGPTCLLSQSTVTPPAQPSVSLITTNITPAALYTLTVTATSTNTNVQVPMTDTVVSVTPDYTLTINTTISPTSVHAGNGATVILDINPVSFAGVVTPVCTSILPAVQFSPICSFNPPTVTVAGATPVQTTLTIATIGPNPTTTTTSLTRTHRFLMALWVLPGFVFCGFALRRPRAGSRWRYLWLLMIGSAFLFLPSCSLIGGGSSTGVTPNNSYTITISAVDTNSVGPSNSAVTVSLTVN